MKITSVETMVIENVEPYRGGRYLLFLEIKTDAVSYTHLTLPTKA